MKIKDKVLIVEDEQSISSFISMILTANGYDTIIVRSGEEALTMIASHCPDMIVLDLEMKLLMDCSSSTIRTLSLIFIVVSFHGQRHGKARAAVFFILPPYRPAVGQHHRPAHRQADAHAAFAVAAAVTAGRSVE